MGGYFETFPHHIMFQATIKNDIEVLDQFTKHGLGEGNKLLQQVNKVKNVIRNAACGPLYKIFENRVFKDTELPAAIYVSGRCFRNEANNASEMTRLHEFNMSEIVFFGKEPDIRSKIEASKKLWKYWIELFDLNCLIETANDSFFAGNYKKLKFFQLLGNSKEEFKILLPHSEKYIASASANFHRTHFTKKYNIKHQEGYCHTGCIAFGIERLAYTVISQLGCDWEKWDKKVLDEIHHYSSL
jgi:seryl-tRNA synthetase